MPQEITGTPTYRATLRAPGPKDRRNAESVQLLAQDAADSLAWLKQAVDGMGLPDIVQGDPVILRGSGKGGLTLTPAADGGEHLLESLNSTGASYQNLRLEADRLRLFADNLVELHSFALDLCDGSGVRRMRLLNDAAAAFTVDGDCSSFALGWETDPSGAGASTTIAAQQGAPGFASGDLILKGGLNSDAATPAGAVRIKLGTPVTFQTRPLYLEREDGTKVLTVYEQSTSAVGIYAGNPPGDMTLVMRGNATNVESNALHIALIPATDLYMGHGSNRDVFHREVGTVVMTEHLDADGATYFRFADGPTEVAIEQVQRATAGAGRPMRIQAQRGNGGKGGDLTLASGAPGTASTHEGGDIILQLHDPIASSSGRLSIMGNATEWLGIERNPASGGILMQCLSYSLSVYSASTMRLQSSGQTQVVGTSVVKGITGGNSTYEELQDANGRVFKRIYIGTAGPITSATNTFALTVATTTDRVYYCRAFIAATNDTDNEGACYEMRGAFKNVAGVLSAVGGGPSTIATHEDTNQTGLAPLLQISGTDIRVGLTTDSTDQVHFNAVLEVYERVLA